MSTTNTAVTSETDNATSVVPKHHVSSNKRPDFGTGKYSALMEEVFDDAQAIFKLTPLAAERLARDIASDVGAIMASAPMSIKTGKISKDGKMTISEACKVKGITITNTLLALKALHYAAEAGMNGFSFGKTEWTPIKQLSEYFAEIESKVAVPEQQK